MHVGVVITDTQFTPGFVANHVLELILNENNEYTHVLARVGYSAFRIEGNKTFDEVYFINHRRRVERPLLIGDTIEWDDKDVINKIVSKIQRIPPLFESRIYGGNSQILVRGVVSPVNKFHFWSQYFPGIQLDSLSAQSVLPNITVSAWLNVFIDSNGNLCIEFDSFEKVEHEGSSMVAMAPWNRDNSMYSTFTIPFSDDGLSSQVLLPDSCCNMSKWQPELLNREGVYTGDRLIFCKELFRYEIAIALFKQSKDSVPLTAGTTCEFSAVWNEYEKRFIVTKYKPKGLKTKRGANELVCLSAKELLRASVKAVPNYPGVFRSNDFGLIDDPRGALALFHLSAYKHSSVMKGAQVTLEDRPLLKSQFRFRIVDAQPNKAAKLEKWMQENEVAVQDVDGVVLDVSTVFSKAHSSIFFHIPKELRGSTSPGERIKFSARYRYDVKEFTITRFSPSSEPAIFSVKKRLLSSAPHTYQRAFRISAAMSNAFECLLEHDVFGLIDMGGHTPPKDKQSSVVVWVMRSFPDPKHTTRPARTPFIVVSTGEREPDEVCLPEEGFCDIDASTPYPVSINHSELKEPSTIVHTSLQEISTVDSDIVVDSAMCPTEITANNHSSTCLIECTDTRCAANCPTLKMIVLITDTVPNFLEILSIENPSLFVRCVNQIFQ